MSAAKSGWLNANAAGVNPDSIADLVATSEAEIREMLKIVEIKIVFDLAGNVMKPLKPVKWFGDSGFRFG